MIGPDTTLKDCEIGAGARVVRTHGELAVIGERANVGPFSYLRPGTQLGVERQDRRLRRDQERRDRRRRQGAAPVLRRRRRDRRGHQHRRRHDLRQLRRRREAPHDGRPARQDRLQQHLRRAGRRSATARRPAAAPSYDATCRRVRWPSPADRSATSRAGPSASAPGRAQAEAAGGRRAGHAVQKLGSGPPVAKNRECTDSAVGGTASEEPHTVTGMKRTTEKNLMVFSGRAHPELAEEVAAPARHRAGAARRRTSSRTPRSTSATRSPSAAATPS